MCVYICMYVRVCVCIYRCKGAVSLPGADCYFQIGESIYQFVYICVCAYIYVCLYVCVCVYIDVKGQSRCQVQTVDFRQVDQYMNLCMYVCSYICIYVCVCIYMEV